MRLCETALRAAFSFFVWVNRYYFGFLLVASDHFVVFKLNIILKEHWYGGYKGVAISRIFEASDIFKAVSDHCTQIRCVLTIAFSQK